MRRQFNDRQRKALFHLSGGLCAHCGVQLNESFHADHIIPYSKGGLTTITNGQALCPACNIKKSDKMRRKQFKPRKWQEDCRIEFFDAKKKKFTIGACPGAGKSKVAAWIMSTLLDKGDIDLIIAVSPQGNKKKEWYDDFLDFFNIPLDPNYSSTSIFKGSKFKGAIMTYQGINGNIVPDIQRLCKTNKVGVIADEPHHLKDDEESKWGTYFKNAFAEAKHMVFLSGTYWREDKGKIPFIDYDHENKRYIIDYQYTYSDSLLDGNSRKVEFEFYDPKISYKDEIKEIYYDGLLSSAPENLLNKCYRKLITERNKDLLDVMQSALIKLHEVRTIGKNKMPNAGMVVFAPDQLCARGLQEWLYSEDFGFLQSTLVVSDDPLSSEKLESFKKSNDKILIAVNMIAEGIDIPRLRVGVYFSLIKTLLFFMQSIVGRLIRVLQSEYNLFQSGEMETVNYSHSFLLKHPLLFEFSKAVENEIISAEIEENLLDDVTSIGQEPKSPTGPRNGEFDFSTIEVVDIGDKEFVNSGLHVTSGDSAALESIFDLFPSVDPNVKSLVRSKIHNYIEERIPDEVVHADPVMDEKRLSDQIEKLVGSIGAQLIKKGHANPKKVWTDIRKHLKDRFKMSLNVKKNDVPMEVLKEAREYAKDLLQDLKEADDAKVSTFVGEIEQYRYGY